MDEKNTTTVTKRETLAALRSPGELYVIISAVTKVPFVVCDDETYDDQILLYYRAEDAREKAKELLEAKYGAVVAKLEDKQLLAFYTSLYTMGVNCLAVNQGTDTAVSVQLSDLVIRKKPEELPEGKKQVENPAFHLTAMYFMQEMQRHAGEEPTQQMKDLQEELLAHYKEGTFIAVIQEDGQIPFLKQKDGSIYQPIFTDAVEFQKFNKNKKLKTAAIPASKIPEFLIPGAKGVAVNPLGVNVQLRVARPETKKTTA